MAKEHLEPVVKATDVADTVGKLLDKVVTQIKGVAVAPPSGETRLFFPDGIDLISVIVKVGPADVEVKIAGPRSGQGQARAETQLLAPHAHRPIEVCESDEGKVHANVGDVVDWTNSRGNDCTVDFNVDGTPFSVRKFVVPAESSLPLTVVGPGGGRRYHYNSTCCPPLRGGQPIVIID